MNISTRAQVGTVENVVIGGFIVSGSGRKKVIIRGIGPSLAGSGVSGSLADPVLELHDNTGTIIATNDNWRDTQLVEITNSGLAADNDLESALVTSLSEGAYTAILSGKNNSTGVGLVEVYDLDTTAIARLANISTRSVVQGSDGVMIGGFILGTGRRTGTSWCER